MLVQSCSTDRHRTHIFEAWDKLLFAQIDFSFLVHGYTENVFAIYFETNIQIFLFLYILFTIHHSLRCWCLLFKAKSGSPKISILVFSRFFVYRCHGNIDFHKM